MFAVVLLLHLEHGDHFIIADTRQRSAPAVRCRLPCRSVPRLWASGLVWPSAVAVDNAGDFVVADEHQIKLCLASSPGALCETVVGFDHPGDSATELSSPQGVFWDPWRHYVIADTGNNRVQRCVAGILHARCDTVTDGLNLPHAVVMDGNGDYVISDTFQPSRSSLQCRHTESFLPDRGGIWFSRYSAWRIWCRRVAFPEGTRHQ